MKLLFASFVTTLISIGASAQSPVCQNQPNAYVCTIAKHPTIIESQQADVQPRIFIEKSAHHSSVPPKPPVQSKETGQQSSNPQQMSTVTSPIIIINGGGSDSNRSPEPQAACPLQSGRIRTIVKTETKTVRVVVREKRKKNAILLMVGIGPTSKSTSVDTSNNTVEVKTEHGPVFGLQYQRHVGEKYLIGGSLLSNTTATLNGGFEF